MEIKVPRPKATPMDATVASDAISPIKNPAQVKMDPDVKIVGNAWFKVVNRSPHLDRRYDQVGDEEYCLSLQYRNCEVDPDTSLNREYKEDWQSRWLEREKQNDDNE